MIAWPNPTIYSNIVPRVLNPVRLCLRNLSTRTNRTLPISDILNGGSHIPHDRLEVNGFIRSLRKQKKVAFAHISDGSCVEPLQAVMTPVQAESLSNGAAVRLLGSWTASEGKGQTHELRVSQVELLGDNDVMNSPIQKKYQTEDFLRTIPHLRVRTATNTLLLRLRSQVMGYVQAFFNEHDFVQSHSPIITSSDCEGAGEVFNVSTTTNELPKNAKSSDSEFFGSRKFLTVSSQLHLEALAQSVGRVWTLSPTFRAERSDTGRHLSEFYMLEAEECFVSELEDVMRTVQDLIQSVTGRLYKSNALQQLQSARDFSSGEETAWVSYDEIQKRWLSILNAPWPRITFQEAKRICENGRAKLNVLPTDETGLQTEHERFVVDAIGQGGPVFVTDYASKIKPFYMLPSDTNLQPEQEPPTVACFDLLMPDVCEIAGGSLREHRFEHIKQAMYRKGLLTSSLKAGTHEVSEKEGGALDWYLDLRRYGSVPHGGFGLGFDRLVAFLTGVHNVRDVVTFPRHYNRCIC